MFREWDSASTGPHHAYKGVEFLLDIDSPITGLHIDCEAFLTATIGDADSIA